MTIYDLKPAFQNLLRPIVRQSHKAGITPNQITTLACALSILLGLYLLLIDRPVFWILPIFFFFRMALNAIDGMLAKEYNMKTPEGAILNEVTDVLSDGFLYYAFMRFSFINSDLVMLVIFLAAITEVTGLAVLLNGKARQYAGPMGKSDRAFVFSILAILISLKIENTQLYNGVFIAMAILLVLTIFNRARKSLR